MGGEGDFKFQIADCKFQISAFAGTSFRLRGKDDFRLLISDTELRGHKFHIAYFVWILCKSLGSGVLRVYV